MKKLKFHLGIGPYFGFGKTDDWNSENIYNINFDGAVLAGFGLKK